MLTWRGPTIAICLALCMILVACGDKKKTTGDGDAEDAPDIGDMGDTSDPLEDPVVDPPEDDVGPSDPVPDPEPDLEPDLEPDPLPDAIPDGEDAADAMDDADAWDDAYDVTSDITTDGATTAVLFFSEYIEGASGHGDDKAVEIYNNSGIAYDIGLCSVRLYQNGHSTPDYTITLTSGALAHDDVWVLCRTGFTSSSTYCDQTSGSMLHNGDDAIELVCNGAIMDVIGQIGTDPGTEWGTGTCTTADRTLRRKSTITTGDTNGSDAFDPATEWDDYSPTDFSGLGSR